MSGVLVGVGVSVLATFVVWFVSRLVRLWHRLQLRRLVLSARRSSLGSLKERLGMSRRPSPAQRVTLAGSFRLENYSKSEALRPEEPQILNAHEFLDQVEGDESHTPVYLVNADSGYGKTILGLTLPTLRSPISNRSLFPIYIDLAKVGGRDPLAALDPLISKLGRRGRVWGRPLIIFDALNETVDPEDFAEGLGLKHEQLLRARAQLLFLFSFRHRSYPGRLRTSLVEEGFQKVKHWELLFSHREPSDLDFVVELVEAAEEAATSRKEIEVELEEYVNRFPSPRLSREDALAYLRWRFAPVASQSKWCSARHPHRSVFSAPSAATLAVDRVLIDAKRGEELLALAEIAFFLLGREATAVTYAEVDFLLEMDERQLVLAISASGLNGFVECGRYHLRFESEATVRVLGAVAIARRLLQGGSPVEFRGRTAYDTSAPYVQPALDWLCLGDTEVGLPAGLVDAVLAELHGPDGPYSFYAGVLASERSKVFGERYEEMNEMLFKGMIDAIDEDRDLTCATSLLEAGCDESRLALDPILDQLFEVMTAYDREAVRFLLRALRNRPSLPKSQAIYLLLNWVDRVAVAPTPLEGDALATIPSRLPADEKNLHVRFHLLELLERLSAVFPNPDERPRIECLSLLEGLAVDYGLVAQDKAYPHFQRLVSLRARLSLKGEDSGSVEAELYSAVEEASRLIGAQGDSVMGEEELECWEVALAMVAHIAIDVRQNARLVGFIDAALEHEYWIVRWWAFNALIRVLRDAAKRGDVVLATRCARRAIDRLYTGVEPMGLKHRQCALISGQGSAGGIAAPFIHKALAEAKPPRPGTDEGQHLAECYYEALEASPDEYLAEFFRRVDDLALAT